MLDRADCADFGCHNSIRLETKHFLNTLALTFISFSGRFVFAMQKHYLFFCERSSSFSLILKNKMAARDVYLTLYKDFCWPSRAKDIISTDLIFAGYVPHYKILTGNIFGLILKNKMAATGVIGPRGLGW